MKSKQWVSNLIAAANAREDSAQYLEQHGVRSSLPSGHLRDIAALPKKDRVKAAKEALDNGGGKRAFRAAAQKAKEKSGRTVSNTKPDHMFTVILTAEKEPDGAIIIKPEITGKVSAEVKARFDCFCGEVKSMLAAKDATVS